MSVRSYLRSLVYRQASTAPPIAEAEARAAAALAELERTRAESAASTAEAMRALDAAALYARRIATETPAQGVRIVSIPDI